MVAKKIEISIIIPSWNTKPLLRRCLRSLETKKKSNFEVIVVDNASSDGSAKMVEKEFPQVILIKNQKNLGYGAANNLGIKKAKGEYLLLLNSDTVVKKNAPEKMAQFLSLKADTGVVGCRLLNPDGTPQPSAGRFPNLLVAAIMLFADRWLGGHLVLTSYNQTRAVDWVMGAALMIKREVVEKIGLMDEGIFMYMDEVEWCYRVARANYKVMFYPGAEIVHLGRASSKTGKTGPILNIYRGLIYLYQKYYPGWQLVILRLMLKLKAAVAVVVGHLTNNHYLKETYAQAFKIA